ncbi:hypothetical protein F5884DRAFT_753846 [Xylogone sp. PMI_703]|nr:hypothetical protein F5884DRAFT_753846 [Xylogone sp. PMI_703]
MLNIKTALAVLFASSVALAAQPPSTWQVTDFSLGDDTGNGLTYSFTIQSTADETDNFKASCTGSTAQASLLPCSDPAVTAVVWSTGVVNGVQGFELHAAYGNEKGEIAVPPNTSSFGLYAYAN